jgi:uroporphyrinogen III methyltransferase/synthase
MGGKRLPEIVQQLQQHGRSPHTPIAVIRWGGWAEQRVWLGILSDITDRTAGESLSPAVVIVGDVVGLQLQSCPANSLSEQREMEQNQLDLSQEGLNSPDPGGPQPQLALSGKTILVTRSATQSSEFSDRLTAAGANVITMPALVIGPPSTWEPLDAAIADLAEFDWLILTSTNGVEAFLDRLMYQGKDLRSLSGIQIAVVGRKTATSLIQRGLQPDFVPPDFIADALVKHFPQKGNLTGIKILFPRVETGGRDTLVAELTAKGANVVEAPAYQSCCPATIEPSVLEALQNQAVDAITFASSKTVQHFCQLLQQASQQIDKPSSLFEWQTWLAGVCIASIGPQTSKACNMLLGRVDLEASEYTLEGLMQSITNYYAGKAYPDSSRLEHDK